MGKKTKQARERLKLGGFKVPSPKEVRDSMTPAGAWTAAQLAEWGVAWPPQKGWRDELRLKWMAQNFCKEEVEEFWRFLPAADGVGLRDRSDDANLACLAVAVATQVTSAGFQNQLLIDLREASCPDCGAPGYNTGMGFWMHACGSEWLSDGSPAEVCGGHDKNPLGESA